MTAVGQAQVPVGGRDRAAIAENWIFRAIDIWYTIQLTKVGVVGIVLSFLACGFIAVAGKRGSAPTMVLSRAAFGVNGNKLPTVISWLLTVGWETVLVILATLATATVFHRLGWGGGTGPRSSR